MCQANTLCKYFFTIDLLPGGAKGRLSVPFITSRVPTMVCLMMCPNLASHSRNNIMGNEDVCQALPGSPEGKDHWINKVLLISPNLNKPVFPLSG